MKKENLNSKLIIGPHMSIAKGFKKAAEEAVSIGANTFQFFTRNPRGGNAKALDEKDIAGLCEILSKNHFGPLLAHAPYTLNMASASEETRDFAKMAFEEDLLRLEQLPCSLYNFHPGSHVGQGSAVGIQLITDILNQCLKPEQTTTVLLEAMAGKGSEIGRSFEELKAIIDGTELSDKLGVCMDTCHVYSAGYDIVNELDMVLDRFDTIIGLDKLKAIHLNDSLTPFASNKDRHANLGEGSLGKEAFVKIVNHSALKQLPFFLETPQKTLQGYGEEIDWLRSQYK